MDKLDTNQPVNLPYEKLGLIGIDREKADKLRHKPYFRCIYKNGRVELLKI